MLTRIALIALALLFSSPADAQLRDLTAKAIPLDGGTLRLRPASEAPMTFRLNGIVAPRIDEKMGPAARAFLDKLVGRKPVTCLPTRQTAKQRYIAVCKNAGGVDLAEAMLAAGMAAHDRRWTEHDPVLTGRYDKAEARAARALLGLWEPPPSAAISVAAKQWPVLYDFQHLLGSTLLFLGGLAVLWGAHWSRSSAKEALEQQKQALEQQKAEAKQDRKSAFDLKGYEDHRRRVELTSALAEEIKALLEIARVGEWAKRYKDWKVYLNGVKKDHTEDYEEPGLRLPDRLEHNYFEIYSANTQNHGVMSPSTTACVVRFYTRAKGLLANIDWVNDTLRHPGEVWRKLEDVESIIKDFEETQQAAQDAINALDEENESSVKHIKNVEDNIDSIAAGVPYQDLPRSSGSSS